MSVLCVGRRLAAFAGKIPAQHEDLSKWLPGDYCGPLFGYTGPGMASVTYLLPNGRIGHVTSPPHRFRECPDGSLEIRNSILHTEAEHGYDWHGYLNEGNVWGDGPGDIIATDTPPPPPTPPSAPTPTPPSSSLEPDGELPPLRFGGDRPVNEAGWPL